MVLPQRSPIKVRTQSNNGSLSSIFGGKISPMKRDSIDRLNRKLADVTMMAKSSFNRVTGQHELREIDMNSSRIGIFPLPNLRLGENKDPIISKNQHPKDSLRIKVLMEPACVPESPTSGIRKRKTPRAGPWGSFRSKLRAINATHRSKDDQEIDIPDSLETIVKKESLAEEFEEMLFYDIKIAKFPEYFSKEEREMVKSVAEKFGLGYQAGDRADIVYKKGSALERRETVSKPDDVFVNVHELESKGKDRFIHALRLRRMDSAGGARSKMLWDVAHSAKTEPASAVEEGDGGVYAMQSQNGEKLAMFKPKEEEKFVRQGLKPGEGAVREEIAYVLDSKCGSYCGVPATAVAQLHLPSSGKAKQGSVQRFMNSKMGTLEDFGMPYNLDDAKKFIPVNEIHKVAILDIRLFNTDRHPGNLLLLGDQAPYNVVPIDHGCILPSWFHMSEARFDWSEYPQAKVPFTDNEMDYIQNINPEEDAIAIRKLGIREECIVTMRICTLVLKASASAGKTPHWIGNFMQRSGCLDKPSELESIIHKACKCVNMPFEFVLNEYKEQTGTIDLGILSRRPPKKFYSILRELLEQFLLEH